MTRSESSQKVYSPRRLKLDKENNALQPVTKRNTPSKSPLRSSPAAWIRSPPGSSKLLRAHFAQLSVDGQSPRRRLMDSGPVRLIASQNKRRIGAEEATTTPCNDLLTPASRGQRMTNDEESVTDQSFGSSMAEDYWESPSHRHTPPRRMNCIDPVAFTLLKGGEEDHSWLLEQDRSFAAQKVSANLLDIYGAYSTKMARPVALWRKGPLYSSSR